MTPETIFIHVWNCHAHVAKYKRAEQGITFIIAANWQKLESEAAEFVETITLSGHYPCEISGIMNENPRNKVSSRVNEKLAQTTPTDHTFSVYVIIVEFSNPYATMVLKNANR